MHLWPIGIGSHGELQKIQDAQAMLVIYNWVTLWSSSLLSADGVLSGDIDGDTVTPFTTLITKDACGDKGDVMSTWGLSLYLVGLLNYMII